jgi:secondary thiamine-phosphate synthase enzyme
MHKIQIKTSRRSETVDITPLLKAYLKDVKAGPGLLTVYCPHTTAGIAVNENADPDVQTDMVSFLNRLIPQGGTRDAGFRHAEGNSDAHIKSTLVNPSQTFIVEDGQLQLGQWQGVLFMEFDGPRSREIWLKFVTA